MRQEVAEVMLARLGPKISSLRPTTPSTNSTGESTVITPQDIAMALGYGKPRLSDIDLKIGLLSFAGEERHRPEVLRWLEGVVSSVSQGWLKCTDGQRKKLAGIILGDMIPDRRCPVCKCRCEIPNQHGVMVECPNCNGRGWIILNDQQRAEQLGVDRSNYSRTWSDRYKQVQVVFESHEFASINKIIMHFS